MKDNRPILSGGIPQYFVWNDDLFSVDEILDNGSPKPVIWIEGNTIKMIRKCGKNLVSFLNREKYYKEKLKEK